MENTRRTKTFEWRNGQLTHSFRCILVVYILHQDTYSNPNFIKNRCSDNDRDLEFSSAENDNVGKPGYSNVNLV